jgi:hypothetical protein
LFTGKNGKVTVAILDGNRGFGCMFAGNFGNVTVPKMASNGVIVAKKPFFMKPTHC